MMETVQKIESVLQNWLKPLPHLPTEWRKWLATNVWWLTMIMVVLSVLGVLGMAGALLTALSIFGLNATFYGVYAHQVYTGLWMVSTLVSFVFMVATILAAGAAVNPLREQKKRGWELLLLANVISIASAAVSAVLNFSVYNFVANVFGVFVGAVISFYLLFEVREYFGAKKTAKAKK